MPNEKLWIIVLAVLFLLSARLLQVAINQSLWREFAVSEFVLIFSAACVFCLLRKSK